MQARKQAKTRNGGIGAVQTAEPPANAKPDVNGQSEDKAAPPKSRPPAWEFLADEERDRDGTGTWLYRLQPVIDRKQGEHAICRKKGRFTRDDILRDFGSGVYQIQVNNAQGKQLYNETISFHNPDLPPRVDPLEVVVGDPRNDTYFATWGKRSSAGAGQGNREAAKGETAEILSTVFEHGKVDPTLVDLWKDTAQQRDQLAKLLSEKQALPSAPTEKPLDLLALITALKTFQPQPQDPLSVLEKLKGFFPARESERTKAEPVPNNSLDELKKVLEVFGEAKTLFTPEAAPVGAAPDAEMWERIAVNLSGQVGPMLQGIAGLVAVFKGAPVQPLAGASGMPPVPTSFDPYKDAARMREFVRAQNTAGPQPAAVVSDMRTASAAGSQPAAGQAPAFASPENAAADPMAAQAISLITQALSCLNRNVDGHQAAGAFIDLQGELVYDTLVEQIKLATTPVTIEIAKGIPEIAMQVTAYEGPLRAFIDQFLQGPAYDDDEEPAAAG